MRRPTLAFSACIALMIGVGCGGAPTPDVEVAPRAAVATTTALPSETAVPSSPAEEPTRTSTLVPTDPPASPTVPIAAPSAKPTASTPPVEYDGGPLPADKASYVVGSGLCAVCHDDLVDASGNDVSIGEHWRSTMMANAARDPYWRAAVRNETLAHPALESVIEAKCATCHTPLAWFTHRVAGDEVSLFDEGLLNRSNELHALAQDGVSCALCHQIQSDGLGEPSSFSGGFGIDSSTPAGERSAFGPFDVHGPGSRLMQTVSGYRPVKGEQTSGSELCATCHTLYTPSVDSAGQIVGQFAEQTPFLELLHSTYADSHTCQSCHMPEAQGEVHLSSTGGPPRAPFSIHAFVGGNAYMLEILRQTGEERDVTASSDSFDATIARVHDQLQSRTATIAIEDAALVGGRLSMDVVVTTLAGHKFPTGFPSRRAWLHVSVRDGQGQVMLESGPSRPDGSILGNDNDEAKDGYEPHHAEITRPDQVQIYESIVIDSEGQVTTILLRGSSYAKDNRLLPQGFDKATADPDIAVYGRAATDGDFGGGGDRTRYSVDVGEAEGPFTVEAELLYQSVGYRWAQNLAGKGAVETRRFMADYDAISNRPIVITTTSILIKE